MTRHRYGADHVAALQAGVERFAPAADLAEHWGECLAHVLNADGRLLAAGNGGSAAQAQHLTAELVGRFDADRRPLSGLCLSSETSTLTALINDYPHDELFARQVQAHGRPGDVCLLFSTSGRSRNVVAAAERATRCGLTVWAMTGKAPNPLADRADSAITIDAATTATVQELHLVALHILCGALDLALDSEASGRASRGRAVLA